MAKKADICGFTTRSDTEKKRHCMRIALVGYMGSGKSTVGRLLAGSLGVPFTDLDDYIAEGLGQTIPAVFREYGEIYFRKQEHRLLKEWLQSGDSGVLAVGGGTPCYAGNMELLLANTDAVCYLQVSVPELAHRLRQGQGGRPLIAHLDPAELPEFIGKHLFERVPFYTMATHVLPAGKYTPEELSAQILEKVS